MIFFSENEPDKSELISPALKSTIDNDSCVMLQNCNTYKAMFFLSVQTRNLQNCSFEIWTTPTCEVILLDCDIIPGDNYLNFIESFSDYSDHFPVLSYQGTKLGVDFGLRLIIVAWMRVDHSYLSFLF